MYVDAREQPKVSSGVSPISLELSPGWAHGNRSVIPRVGLLPQETAFLKSLELCLHFCLLGSVFHVRWAGFPAREGFRPGASLSSPSPTPRQKCRCSEQCELPHLFPAQKLSFFFKIRL